jgi:hypothetical protein
MLELFCRIVAFLSVSRLMAVTSVQFSESRYIYFQLSRGFHDRPFQVIEGGDFARGFDQKAGSWIMPNSHSGRPTA